MGKLQKKIQDLQKENHRLRLLCDRDFLTGLFCRRKLEQDVWRYTDLYKRYKIKFSILMIDINNFKEINDTRGHKVGDKVLRQVAYTLQKSIRASDKAYRLGGDEFVIIFSHHKTKIFVKRIKEALEDMNIKISVGYCDISNGQCMEKIDKRMYEEKRK